MKMRSIVLVGLTGMVMALAPAMAQEMNHSGTTSPDAADQNQNLNQGKAASTPKPDTRSTAAKPRTTRHHAKKAKKKTHKSM